jgi:hypothetical protein
MVVKLYEFSMSLLTTVEYDHVVNVDIMLITFAIISNVGDIHHQMQQSIQAHQCFERLLSFMVYLRGVVPAKLFSLSPMERWWDGFLLNIIPELNILKQAISALSA